MQPQTSIAHFPTIIFTSIMGMSTLSIGYYELAESLPVLKPLAISLHIITSFCLLALLGMQLLKVIRHPQTVAQELLNPRIVGGYSTIPICFVLQAQVWSYWDLAYSEKLWFIGVIGLSIN